jgi:4-hydroxybenzoate polyprenyltransferase
MQETDNHAAHVADAASTSWVYLYGPKAVWPYAQLARWDRPIGWQLLMWPCFWATALAANVAAQTGTQDRWQTIWHLLLFFIGSVAMRGAGCTYNDLVDQNIDAQVARTRSRPLPSGRVTRKQAWLFLAAQAFVGLLVLLQFNGFTILLGIGSLAIVALYPFAKRVTDWPQLVLGLAFSWGGLVGWSAQFGALSLSAGLLYMASVVWTVGYDTIYAHQDKDDDALIGVRSTARLFGKQTKPWLSGLYALMLVLLCLAYSLAGLSWVAYSGVLAAAIRLGWQVLVLNIDDADQCLVLFRDNSRVGAMIFLGLLAALAMS